jgi:hypothetical protein
MEDLRVKEQEKQTKNRKFKNRIIFFWKKRKWWIISILVLSIIIIFPTESGQAIGQWIHDFIGNMVKYSKF